MASSTVILPERRPVQVLHEGRWIDGWLEAYRQEPAGWRGCVRYTVEIGATYYQWRDKDDLRRVQMM